MSRPSMHPVDSSCVARLGYDRVEEEVYVEFHGGAVYAYEGVPPAVYEQFERAESKGTFLNAAIKPRYPARKL
jgi:hypothetical protein